MLIRSGTIGASTAVVTWLAVDWITQSIASETARFGNPFLFQASLVLLALVATAALQWSRSAVAVGGGVLLTIVVGGALGTGSEAIISNVPVAIVRAANEPALIALCGAWLGAAASGLLRRPWHRSSDPREDVGG